MKVTVIGIGQSLRGDDAAGLEAVRLWRQSYPATANQPEVTVQTSELPGLGLLDLLSGPDAAVLVDAVRSSAPAGFIHRLGREEISAFASGSQSAHGWGVAETLALAGQLDLPAHRIKVRIVGIEATQVGIGANLSPEVERALPAACAAIEAEVRTLLS